MSLEGADWLPIIMLSAAEYHSNLLVQGATLRLDNYFNHQNSRYEKILYSPAFYCGFSPGAILDQTV